MVSNKTYKKTRLNNYNQFSVGAVPGPISPLWINDKCSTAHCVQQLSEKIERYMEKAPRYVMKCRQYFLIGLELVQRKLGISLVGLFKL